MQKIPNSALGRLSPEAFAATEKYPVVVVLDNIRSLNNVGSFFRTCDAFAMERIVLCGITATPPNKEIHKTALGAELTVRWDYEKLTTDAFKADEYMKAAGYTEKNADALQQLRGEGYTLLAVEQVEKAARLTTFEVEKGKKYALVFGNEVDGVAQEAVDLCDGAVEIPQQGTKHSLNVAVSGGVVLWEFFRQMVLF